MKLKKVVCILLVITMSFALLIACGGEEIENPGESSNQDAVMTLKLAHTVAEDPNHPYTVASNAFKASLEELSGGTMKVDIYPGGQLGGDTDLFQALQMNNLDASVLSTPVIANTTNVLIGNDMPFIFNGDYDLLREVQGGETGQALLERLDEEVEGIKSVCFLYQPFRHIWTKEEISSLDDMKGLKFRCMQTPVHIDIFSALGSNPTAIAYNDIYSSMQTGTIDGFEMDVFGAESNKFYEVCKNMAISSHFNNSPMLILNEQMFDNLTEEQQGWVLQASQDAATASFEGTVNKEREFIEKMEKEHGVKVKQIDLTDWELAVQPVIDKYAAEVPEVQMMVDAIKK